MRWILISSSIRSRRALVIGVTGDRAEDMPTWPSFVACCRPSLLDIGAVVLVAVACDGLPALLEFALVHSSGIGGAIIPIIFAEGNSLHSCH